MRGLNPARSVDWVYDGPPARHVVIRVGQGEALPLTAGSGVLIGGVPLPVGGAVARVTPRPDPERAALHRAGSGYEVSPYGVRVPTGEVSGVTGDTVRVPLSQATAPAARFQFSLPSPPTFTARVAGRDVLALTGATGPARLVMTVQTDAGEQIRTLDLNLDDTPPTGSVSVSHAAGYTYVTYRDLSEDAAALHLHHPDHPTVTVTRPAGERGRAGVLGAATPAAPARVTATDDAGNESADLLVRASTLTLSAGQGSATPLAPWPLPAYLNEHQPVLNAVLTAAAQALSIGADEAGQALDLREAGGRELDALCAYYGVTRRPGEPDDGLARRARARFEGGKSTRAGLATQLREVDAGQITVTDGNSQNEGLRTLNGTWRLDGAVQLGGAAYVTTLTPGQVILTFDRVPLRGWPAAQRVTRTRKAAGVIPAHRLMLATHAVLAAHARTTLAARYAAQPTRALGTLTGTRYSGVLNLDGTWTLNGAETLDGSRSGTQVTPL